MSNTDTRSVSTDALDTLGLIHWQKEKRDAIHLAVEAVEAASTLQPGARIGVFEGFAYPADSLVNNQTVPYQGIVDPFLSKEVMAGQRFWFVMKPREVRSLRHVWEHPDFPEGD